MAAPATGSPAPTVMISWAHRDPSWTDDQARKWSASVVTFARLLRENGVDADLDLWHITDPGIDWTRWGPRQVNTCDFTVIVISRAWRDRWEGTNNPAQGAGAVAEADALKGRFNNDQQEFQRRTLVALLPGVSSTTIPGDLSRLLRVEISDLSAGGIELLLRAIFDAPTYAKPALGRAPSLRPAGDDLKDVGPMAVPSGTSAAWMEELSKIRTEIEHLRSGGRESKIDASTLRQQASLLEGAILGAGPNVVHQTGQSTRPNALPGTDPT